MPITIVPTITIKITSEDITMIYFKIISVLVVIAIIAYLDDPNNFTLDDEIPNNKIIQASMNTDKGSIGKQQEQPLLGSFVFTGSSTNQSKPTKGQKITIASCVQQQDKILANAFMLPPEWQVQCDTRYKIESHVLWSDSLFKAYKSGSSIQLFNEAARHFLYDETVINQMLKSVNMPEYGYADQGNRVTQFRQQVLNSYPKAIDLVQFANQQLPAIMQKGGYKIYHISQDPIANSIKSLAKTQNVKVNAITVIAHAINNPNKIKMMKLIQPIQYFSSNKYYWHLYSYVATGNKQNEKQMSQLLNMVMMTEQENPVFTQLLVKVNSKRTMQTIKNIQNTYAIRKRANDEINNMMMNTYRSSQTSSDRSQSKWVDGMLEVETYTNPFDGKQVKMPSNNDYYYTNNIGDYIGTSNPLFDPNVDLTYLYNWRKLEKSNI